MFVLGDGLQEVHGRGREGVVGGEGKLQAELLPGIQRPSRAGHRDDPLPNVAAHR